MTIISLKNNQDKIENVNVGRSFYLFLTLLPSIGILACYLTSLFRREGKTVIINHLLFCFIFIGAMYGLLTLYFVTNSYSTEEIYSFVEKYILVIQAYTFFVNGVFAILYSPYIGIIKVRQLIIKRYKLVIENEENIKQINEICNLKIPFYILIR